MILSLLISLLLLPAAGATVFSGASAFLIAEEDTAAPAASKEEASIDIGEIIFEHIGDEYEWHITEWKGKPIAIPLPCRKEIIPSVFIARVDGIVKNNILILSRQYLWRGHISMGMISW